ncbi:MAG: stage II sporulation protein R [Clostridia bacterium]|nr:stage II sporulation protein R [Clostridia bacterium]
MKRLLIASVSVVLAFVSLSFLPVHGEDALYRDVIRFHVVAASDSEEDQALKLLVRDKTLSLLEERLAGVTDRDEAAEIISSALPEIEEAARETVASGGKESPVRATLTREAYPVRYYDGFVLPRGEYTSLRVVIGEGEGHNWWCVLFPSFCAAASGAEDDYLAAGFTDEQFNVIRRDAAPKYKVRFKILEVLSDIFGFSY